MFTFLSNGIIRFICFGLSKNWFCNGFQPFVKDDFSSLHTQEQKQAMKMLKTISTRQVAYTLESALIKTKYLTSNFSSCF
jgi:hypothetical protein